MSCVYIYILFFIYYLCTGDMHVNVDNVENCCRDIYIICVYINIYCTICTHIRTYIKHDTRVRTTMYAYHLDITSTSGNRIDRFELH